MVRRDSLYFAVILIGFCIYAGLFIYRTSFLVDGRRYFCLFDDEMVSMRYAKNFSEGKGLVWNPGERVEGYTNPAWVLLMTFIHLFPVDPSKVSILVQISGAIFLIVTLIFLRKIANFISNESTPVTLAATCLTAFYYPLLNWSLQGLEVSLLILVVTAGLWIATRCMRSGQFSYFLYPMLGASTLVRLDMAVFYLLMFFFLFIADPVHRKKHWKYGLACLIVFVSIQTIFRFLYYGELLPNTYYLKMTGFPLSFRLSRGLFVFGWFVWHMNWVLFLIAFSALLFRRDKYILLLYCTFIAQAAYSIYVGGDSWEGSGGANRFLSIAMPAFFTLFALALIRLIQLVMNHLSLSPRSSRYAPKLASIFLVFASLLSFNSFNEPTSLLQWLLIKRAHSVEDNIVAVQIAEDLKKITTPDAKIAGVRAGVTPYFVDRYWVDLLGKNDKRIAREKMKFLKGHERFEKAQLSPPSAFFQLISFYPGHQKWNYEYSIGKRKPDLIVQLWKNPEEADPFLKDYTGVEIRNVVLLLRKQSPAIRWDRIILP